ncbi:penicillin-insensitive murein endopeptidase [Vibrio sp. JPW-9-11-11]|uniref:penicillin-insensitive murein endopeptidase n=1 Tax=Vibrio sp. JPW-9-11-11 TaxID=1416532 RepID=UPI0015931B88|nr:penicillin-insensitive murein endopeptidase [Vibrio sp. JPW-9-11-11]NVD05957.1 penicillin-insensitive murein endopeptidase [Vibrio sp. JPW-9-11-11]
MDLRNFLTLLVSVALCLVTLTAHATQWEQVTHPSPHLPQAIGSYANGCLTGAEALPLEGDGYQVLRRERARYFGHPNAISFVQSLAKLAHYQLNVSLLIGDLSLPQGGRFSSGHSSHQTGLDIDIWLRLAEHPLSEQQLARPEPLSVVDVEQYRLLNTRWQSSHFELVKLAASDEQVARIFVHPVIKQQLCDSELSGDRAWLRKIRPWWGHHYHMHVRLKCPANNSACRPQAEPPAGDGCGSELASWKPQPKPSNLKPAANPAKKRVKIMPKQCLELLQLTQRSPTR